MDFEGGDRTGVVEYGVVELTAEGIRNCWTGLCSPISVVPRMESDTHGLYDYDLAGQPPFDDFWPLFRDLRRKGPFLAHSAQVEDRFLRRQWRTPGETMDWSSGANVGFQWGPWIDSCGIFRSIRPDGDAGLGALIEEEELKRNLDDIASSVCPENRSCWHAALYDTLACALLFDRALQYRPKWSLRRIFRESRGFGESPAEQTELL